MAIFEGIPFCWPAAQALAFWGWRGGTFPRWPQFLCFELAEPSDLFPDHINMSVNEAGLHCCVLLYLVLGAVLAEEPQSFLWG